MPLPWVGLMAMCGSLAQDGKEWVAIALVVGFVCYLRPGEFECLTHQQLVAPTPHAGATDARWGLVLHPSAEGRMGKTGMQGEAISIDR